MKSRQVIKLYGICSLYDGFTLAISETGSRERGD